MSAYDYDRQFPDLTEADIVRRIEAHDATPEQEDELTRRLGRAGLTWTWAVEQDYLHKDLRDVVSIRVIEEDE